MTEGQQVVVLDTCGEERRVERRQFGRSLAGAVRDEDPHDRPFALLPDLDAEHDS
jgi:hypothetical protein